MTDLRPELARRQSHTEQVLAVFKASPHVWIHWTVFSELVGERAYRTRISNAKEVVTAAGGTIESREDRDGRRIDTRYRYTPQTPLGRDASLPTPPGLLFALHERP